VFVRWLTTRTDHTDSLWCGRLIGGPVLAIARFVFRHVHDPLEPRNTRQSENISHGTAISVRPFIHLQMYTRTEGAIGIIVGPALKGFQDPRGGGDQCQASDVAGALIRVYSLVHERRTKPPYESERRPSRRRSSHFTLCR